MRGRTVAHAGRSAIEPVAFDKWFPYHTSDEEERASQRPRIPDPQPSSAATAAARRKSYRKRSQIRPSNTQKRCKVEVEWNFEPLPKRATDPPSSLLNQSLASPIGAMEFVHECCQRASLTPLSHITPRLLCLLPAQTASGIRTIGDDST